MIDLLINILIGDDFNVMHSEMGYLRASEVYKRNFHYYALG